MSRSWIPTVLAWCAIGWMLAPEAAFANGVPLPRQPNVDLRIDSLPPTSPGTIVAVQRFGVVTVGNDDHFTDLQEVPDGTGRMVAVQKNGMIRVFPRKDDLVLGEVGTWLDLTGDVCTEWEAGLLSIAFDPGYAVNGRFYVVYVPLDARCAAFNPSGPWRLSRFTNADPTGVDIDPLSEEVLIEEPQYHFFHKGSALAFGSDGYLYASLGDSSDPHTAQDTTNLRGSVLRIDVTGPPDPGLPYAVPPDNPFVAGAPHGTATRPEIWAYGFRNPWRMSFETFTGRLLVGDVGEEAYEEINDVRPGLNYGWPYFDANDCVMPAFCGTITQTPPIAFYNHFGGLDAIMAGSTWTSGDVPDLYGIWLYADILGRLYGLVPDGDDFQSIVLNNNLGIMIASTGRDAEGRVYFLQGFATTNGIYTLEVSGGSTGEGFPLKLSDLPAFLAAGIGIGETVDGVIPYTPSAQLWSDGALKERYLALPDLEQIGYRNAGSWDFPDETILVKNFLLPLDDRDPEGTAKRIETRLLLKLDGDWHGFSYEWNEDETDAHLLPSSKSRAFERVDIDGNPYAYDWYYPSRGDCMTCHTSAANHVLGLNTAALNHPIFYSTSAQTQNQMEAYLAADLFEVPPADPVAQLPAMPDYHDTSALLHDRARAYFASNCSMCHQPGAPAPTTIDLRWESEDLGLLAQEPTRGDLGVDGALLVMPQAPDSSVTYLRMRSLNLSQRMPPLATSVVDEEGTEVIRQWIMSFSPISAASGWQHYE